MTVQSDLTKGGCAGAAVVQPPPRMLVALPLVWTAPGQCALEGTKIAP